MEFVVSRLTYLALVIGLCAFVLMPGTILPTSARNFDPEDEVEMIPESDGDVIGSNAAETREMAGDFKNLVFLALRELAYEGRLNPELLSQKPTEVVKRGRHQGFCFKRTRSGRFLPYICWKENDP